MPNHNDLASLYSQAAAYSLDTPIDYDLGIDFGDLSNRPWLTEGDYDSSATTKRDRGPADYLNIATEVLNAADFLTRKFKGLPQRPEYDPNSLVEALRQPEDFNPYGFEVPGYDVPDLGSEDKEKDTDPFNKAVEEAPEAVLSDDAEIPVFDEETNEVIRFPQKFLEKHNYKIIKEGGQLKGYIRPDGTKVLYTK